MLWGHWLVGLRILVTLASHLASHLAQIPTGEIGAIAGPVGTASGYGLALFVFTVYRAEKRDVEARWLSMIDRVIKAIEDSTNAKVELRTAITSMSALDRLTERIDRLGAGDAKSS